MTDSIKMNIKPEAQELLKKHIKPGQVVLLALDDGSNKYSNLGGTCKIGADFQFVILNQKDPKFDIKVENNAGLTMYTSKDELTFLTGTLVVKARNAVLSLSDDSGLIDGACNINEFKLEKLTKQEMISGKTC